VVAFLTVAGESRTRILFLALGAGDGGLTMESTIEAPITVMMMVITTALICGKITPWVPATIES